MISRIIEPDDFVQKGVSASKQAVKTAARGRFHGQTKIDENARLNGPPTQAFQDLLLLQHFEGFFPILPVKTSIKSSLFNPEGFIGFLWLAEEINCQKKRSLQGNLES